MPIKAKDNSSYKDVTDLMNVDESIDYVLAKTASSYKRVYTATRSIEDTPPMTFKSIKPGANLTDYRIYGQTVDGESVGDRTGNLFDEIYPEINVSVKYRAIYVGTGFFTLSGDIPIFSNTANLFLLSGNVSSGASSSVNGVGYGASRSVESIDGYITIGYRNLSDVDPRDYNIMLNVGSTPLPYEPYGYKVPVTVEGKNLLPNTATSQTINGVTFTVNEDGSVTCNGTAGGGNAPLIIPDFTLPTGHYIVNGSPAGGDENTAYKILIYVNRVWRLNDKGSGGNFILTETAEVSVRIAIYSGYTCDNLTFYPMIRKADIEDDTYEPYHAPVTTPIYLPEQIKKVGDEAEYIDYGTQKQHRVRKNYLQSSDFEGGAILTGQEWGNFTYQDSKTYPGISDFDTTRKRSTDLITIIGTYTISIADGWEFGIVMFPNDRNSGDLFIYNTEPVTISNCTFAIQIKKTDLSDISSADISDYKIMLNKGSTPLPYEPYIENTDLDVTLPALPTLTGANVLSVGTEVQPSEIDITGHIKEVMS